MKSRLNAQATLSSVIHIVLFAFLLVLLTGVVAKACGPLTAVGCDVNCTEQIINDCPNPNTQACVLRTCDDCSGCPGKRCERSCLKINVCGGCVPGVLPCDGLMECCKEG
jgi:hypothetical protein